METLAKTLPMFSSAKVLKNHQLLLYVLETTETEKEHPSPEKGSYSFSIFTQFTSWAWEDPTPTSESIQPR